MELITILITIGSCIWCVNICERKNRTQWKGFLLGLFFGLFGVLGCYILDDKNKKL